MCSTNTKKAKQMQPGVAESSKNFVCIINEILTWTSRQVNINSNFFKLSYELKKKSGIWFTIFILFSTYYYVLIHCLDCQKVGARTYKWWASVDIVFFFFFLTFEVSFFENLNKTQPKNNLKWEKMYYFEVRLLMFPCACVLRDKLKIIAPHWVEQ